MSAANRSQFLGWMTAIVYAGVAVVSSSCAPEAKSGVDGLVAAPQRASELTSVTRAFGPAVLSRAILENRGITYHASFAPWTGWWYPKKSTYFFQGPGPGQSPLEKYDAYVAHTRGTKSSAAAVEQDVYLRFWANSNGFEGHCHALARASVLEPEPGGWMDPNRLRPVTVGGVSFTVGDLKALLVKSYEIVGDGQLQSFGQRNDGQQGLIYDDIYPDQLLRLVQIELGERKHPFIIDDDPTVAVWNSPVYKAMLVLNEDSADEHVIHAKLTLVLSKALGIGAFDDPYAIVDRLGANPVLQSYSFDLLGNRRSDGSFEVVFGNWTGESINDHPDFATVAPMNQPVDHRSTNKELDTAVVQEILTRARAQLELMEPPGANRVALDPELDLP